MNKRLGRVFNLAEQQRGVVAVWQMKELGFSQNQVNVATRGWRRVHRGVYAVGDLDELGWFRAATLIAREAVLSHGTALALLGLIDEQPAQVHVTLAKRSGAAARDGLVIHRPRRAVESGLCYGIPVTSPTQSLRDARLEPAELFHAIDRAEDLGYPLTLPLNGIFELQQATHGGTKSVAEAAFVLLCKDHGIEPPLVNHHLNGIETDFHWPAHRLVVEVDGFEFHKTREQFEEDRRRGMVHGAAGHTVVRVSASQVRRTPDLLVAAVNAHMRGQNGRHRRG